MQVLARILGLPEEQRQRVTLHSAAGDGNLNAVRELLRHANAGAVNAPDEDLWTPLHAAIWNGHVAVAAELLLHGASPNLQDNAGRPPLHLAALRNNAAAAKLLLDNGANPDTPDMNGMTALHRAVAMSHADVVAVLLDANADINFRTPDGMTVLHVAAWKGDMGVVEQLLARGATIDARAANNARTPLHEAAMAGHALIVQQLIDAGADIGLRDQTGRTAEDYAFARSQRTCYELLSAARVERQEAAKQRAQQQGDDGWGADDSAAAARNPLQQIAHAQKLYNEQKQRAKEAAATTAGRQTGGDDGWGDADAGVSATAVPRSTVAERQAAVAAAAAERIVASAPKMPSDNTPMYPTVHSMSPTAPPAYSQPTAAAMAPASAAAAADRQTMIRPDLPPAPKVESAGVGGPFKGVQNPLQQIAAAQKRFNEQKQRAKRDDDDDDYDSDDYELEDEDEKQRKPKDTRILSHEEAVAQLKIEDAKQARKHGLIRRTELEQRLQAMHLAQQHPRFDVAAMARAPQDDMAVMYLNNQLQSARQAAEFRSGSFPCPLVPYADLAAATGGFNTSNLISEGRGGKLYKATLNHVPVSVKVLNQSNAADEARFNSEVDVLSRVRHPNIVLLLAACPAYRMLVYEALDRGSLEDMLLSPNAPPLPWTDRLRIAKEIALALMYLHAARPAAILHGSVACSAVQLDAHSTAKLGDVGLSRFGADLQADASLLLDPEYLQTGRYSKESDVYGLGVVMLQLLTGKQARPAIDAVLRATQHGMLHDVIDSKARGWPVPIAKAFASLALRCTEPSAAARPSLEAVVLPTLERLIGDAGGVAAVAAAVAAAEEPPAHFFCPITSEVMVDPVVAADGYTYERSAMQQWIDTGHMTSPMTNGPLAHPYLTPNHTLRSAIMDWLEQHKTLETARLRY